MARISLALLVSVGLAAGQASAQHYAPYVPNVYTGPPSPYAGPAQVNPAWFGEGPISNQGPGCNKCTLFFNSIGMHCWSHHTLPITGNFKTNYVFIFGSSKAYFCEPCLCSRPLVPVPPGYEPFYYGTYGNRW
jgi:hypothetical protein